MRPTDEDQAGSRRPNLMSSTRRTASETNILAMLERRASGRLRGRLLRLFQRLPGVTGYAAAGALVIGLVGMLAWLARDGGPQASTVEATAGIEDAGRRQSAAPAASAATAAPAKADGAAARDAALAAAPAATAEPADPHHFSDMPPPPRPGGSGAPRDERHALSPARQRRLPQATASRTARPPRSRRSEASAQPAPDAVDIDVALISAIIQHANQRQHEEDGGKH